MAQNLWKRDAMSFPSEKSKTEMEEVKDVKIMRRIGVGVIVYQNGARGYSFTTKLSKGAIEEATKRAIKSKST